MRCDDIFAVLGEYFDPEQCFKWICEINKTDRWFDFFHFSSTAEYCAGQMEVIGLSEVDMLPLKADGKTAYGDWVAPKAWDVFGAELEIVHPDGKHERIVDYMSVPACLMMYSAPTQDGGVEAEVIVAEEPFMPYNKDIRGKIILTGKPPKDFVPLASTGGFLGIVSDYLPLFPGVRDSREECRKAFRWENSWIYPVNDAGLFGFSLSPEKGDYLREVIRRAALKGESIRLYANVRTKFYDGFIYTVSGKIPGSQPQQGEVLVISHLYEPGANDNATGCGLSIGLAAAMKRAVDEGRLPRPERDIRFVMGYECLGLMGYSEAYPERISNTIAAINLDMVGSSVKDRARLHLWHNPLSSWSYTDTLLPLVIRAYGNFTGKKIEFVETGFSIGDNLLADPAFGVPTMSMLMHPALSYHSSCDTADLVDMGVLKQNAVISGMFTHFLANPDGEGVERLVEELRAKSDCRGLLTLDCLLKKRVSCLDNLELQKTSDVGGTPFAFCKEITIDKEMEERLKKIVPVRMKKGTLSLHTLASEIRENAIWKPYYDYQMNCALFWTDGIRNLYEIGRLASCELGEKDPEGYMAELLEYYVFLKKNGYIDWNE